MKNKIIWPHIIVVILVVVFVWLNNSEIKQNKIIQSLPGSNQALSSRETAKVLRVVDGDTIEVLINNRSDTIRLIGIDSPEILDERKPVQCFGKEASDEAKKVLIGKTIILESDSTQGERDEYGRLLRYVFFESLNFNELMISGGYAREYTFKGKAYKYQSEFIQAEEKAREENQGLWESC